MVGTVSAVTINEDDRTVDITVSITQDTGQLVNTVITLVPIDTFTEQMVIDKIKDILDAEILRLSPIPYTQAQVEALILGLPVRVPG